VFVYLLGVIGMLAKLAGAIYGGQRLRRACRPVVDRGLLDLLAVQARRLGLRLIRHRVLRAGRGAGRRRCLRPMILLPAAMISGLAPDQLEAVADARIGAFLLSTIWRSWPAVRRGGLFFHPAGLVSEPAVYEERECCCDDLVLAAGGDRLGYAASLLRVAELNSPPIRAAASNSPPLAADGGNPSRLRQRIARLWG